MSIAPAYLPFILDELRNLHLVVNCGESNTMVYQRVITAKAIENVKSHDKDKDMSF